MLRRGKCSGVAAAAGWEGTTGGTRGLLRRVGLVSDISSRFGALDQVDLDSIQSNAPS